MRLKKDLSGLSSVLVWEVTLVAPQQARAMKPEQRLIILGLLALVDKHSLLLGALQSHPRGSWGDECSTTLQTCSCPPGLLGFSLSDDRLKEDECIWSDGEVMVCDTLLPFFCQQYWWIHLLIHAWMFMCASFHLSSSLSHFYRLCGIDWFFTLSRDWEGRERRCWASVDYYFSQSVWHEWSLRSCDHKPGGRFVLK